MPGQAKRLVEQFRIQHHSLAVYYGHDETKAPGWFLHLPSGEVLRIRRFEADEPLLRVFGWDAKKDIADIVLIAPEILAITIQSLPPEAERFEVEFSTNGSGPSG